MLFIDLLVILRVQSGSSRHRKALVHVLVRERERGYMCKIFLPRSFGLWLKTGIHEFLIQFLRLKTRVAWIFYVNIQTKILL